MIILQISVLVLDYALVMDAMKQCVCMLWEALYLVFIAPLCNVLWVNMMSAFFSENAL